MIKVLSVFLFACVGAILGQYPSEHYLESAGGRYLDTYYRPHEVQLYRGQGLGYGSVDYGSAYYGQQGLYGGYYGNLGGQQQNNNERNFGRYSVERFGEYSGPYNSYNRQNGGNYNNANGGQQYISHSQEFSEPANYEFGYQVSDPQSQVEFGHQEQRQGDSTQGSYQVLLPDGRTQVVHYTADENGFRPVITYHENVSSYGDRINSYGDYNRSYRNNGSRQ